MRGGDKPFFSKKVSEAGLGLRGFHGGCPEDLHGLASSFLEFLLELVAGINLKMACKHISAFP